MLSSAANGATKQDLRNRRGNTTGAVWLVFRKRAGSTVLPTDSVNNYDDENDSEQPRNSFGPPMAAPAAAPPLCSAAAPLAPPGITPALHRRNATVLFVVL